MVDELRRVDRAYGQLRAGGGGEGHGRRDLNFHIAPLARGGRGHEKVIQYTEFMVK